MGGNGPIDNELDAQTKAAVKKGLDWLSKNVSDSGLTGGGSAAAGIMGLAGLAFMADGSMPGDGPYGKEVDRILDFVLKNCQESGLVAAPSDGSPMYGHGFATLFLAEVYGMSQGNDLKRNDLKEKLQRAIRLMVTSQNTEGPNGSAGGWRYQPVRADADLSVTICQIMALRAARNSGVKIPIETINKSLQYVKLAQESDGGFKYMLNSGGSGYARTGAGVACMFYLRSGNDLDKEIANGVKYLSAHMPTVGRDEGHFYYGNYYATQAMFMAGGDPWKKFWPAIRSQLLTRQRPTGAWEDGEGGGPVYSTSMALIMLQIPNRLLPILQK
jgi:hypothetical protein